MPLLHCKSCHHEWEGSRTTCDWCDCEGEIIQEKTSLEMMLSDPIRLNDLIRSIAKEKM